MSNTVYPVATPMPITAVWVRNLEVRSGALAFESPAAEQNVPDSGYVAVHTGVNHKAFL